MPRWRRPTAWQIGVLALIAYVPPLRSSPGRMPSDTKLGLYLNPGRLLSDAPWMWDARQFGGWVPHQAVGYLWPMGPWFWLGERVGLPDWVTHRLWLGTLVFVAATGARWAARRMGLSPGAATAAALAYGLSPYILPYVARTSGQLPNWAALGWIVGLTSVAVGRLAAAEQAGGRLGRWVRWREPALLALVVATASGLNATAMLLVVPAPALWVLDAGLRREVSWRRLSGFLWRTGVACVGAVLWWVAGLVVQGRYGADVLGYTETLEAVSFTSSGGEVLRGLGYWLTYVTDRTGPLTSSAVRYQISIRAIALAFALVVAACAGLAVTRWRGRRFTGWTMLAGLAIGVGVHPLHSPAPLFRSLASDPESGLALALRSSTRAVPCLVLGVALGAGALADAWGRWITARMGATKSRPSPSAPVLAGAASRRRTRIATAVGPIAVALVAGANLPAWWQGELFSAAQLREQEVPVAWREAAAYLDTRPDRGRVLQLPGAEFGVHRWGTLVDPLLPSLTDRPLITRDLVPGGSAGAMDLLYALDDRVQDGLLEPAAIAPVARLLGAGDVLVPGDLAIERYRTRRPTLVDALLARAPGLDAPTAFGSPEPTEPSPPYDDGQLDDPVATSEVPPVIIRGVDEPTGLVRAGAETVLVVGSGEGVVDAAEAGLLDGHEVIRYAAALDDEELAAAGTGLVVVTDSNRRQARQWRGSRDTAGATEPVDGTPVIRPDRADHRLAVFPVERPADQTTVTASPVRAMATGYGDPVSYRPEDRPSMAVDGDPGTAWRVADRAEAVGERLLLRTAAPIAPGSITLRQADADGADARWITQVRVATAGGAVVVDLGEESRRGAGQAVELPDGTTDWVEIGITATDISGRDAYPGVGPVGFAEVGLPGITAEPETVVLPTRIPMGGPLAVVLSRRRADPDDRWRSDPEPTLRRSVTLPRPAGVLELSAEIRVDPRISDASLSTLLGVGLPTATTRQRGAPEHGAWAAIDEEPATRWVTGGDDPTGATIEVPLAADPGAAGEAAAVIVDFADDSTHSRPTRLSWSIGATTRSLEVPADAALGSLALDVAGMSGGSMRLTIDAVEARTAVDSRTGESIIRPVAIGDIRAPFIARVALPTTVALSCDDDVLTIDGAPMPVQGTVGVAALLAGEPVRATACEEIAWERAGEHRLVATGSAPWQVDRVLLSSPGVAGRANRGSPGTAGPTAREVGRGRVDRTAEVGGCAAGCWVVLAEGVNAGWRATVDGRSLGEPTAVDGGFAGWYLPPGAAQRRVEFRWLPQRTMWMGFAASALALALCLVVVWRTRCSPAVAAASAVQPSSPLAPVDGSRWAPVLLAFGLTALVAGPTRGLAAALVAMVAALIRRPRLVGVAGALVVAGIAVWYVVHQRAERPASGYGWVINVEPAHGWALLGICLVAVAVSRARDERGRTGRDRATPNG